MTRTKKCAQQGLPKKKKTKSTTSAAVADPTAETSQVVEAPTVSQTPEDLLLQAAHLIAACLYEEARVVSVQAVDLAVELEDATLLTDALEVLGTVELELGELEAAKEHFTMSIQHATVLADPSPSPHLYLAQLSSPEESLVHFSNALTILQAKLAVMENAKLGGDGSAGTEADVEEEGELRRSASRALVGMTELYLTDLCYDPEAEQNCEKHLSQASILDPSDPEVYQTLASVRLSQERPEDAKAAAHKGWSIWRDLEPDDDEYPPAPARLTLAKLFLELSEHASALEILQRLENEDDEDAEVWYLSGWAWWLLGEVREAQESKGADEESREECWSEGKLCLENYLKLDAREPEQSDPEQLAHVKELIGKFDAAGIIASTGQNEEDEEWEDDSDAGEGGDVEMA